MEIPNLKMTKKKTIETYTGKHHTIQIIRFTSHYYGFAITDLEGKVLASVADCTRKEMGLIDDLARLLHKYDVL